MQKYKVIEHEPKLNKKEKEQKQEELFKILNIILHKNN